MNGLSPPAGDELFKSRRFLFLSVYPMSLYCSEGREQIRTDFGFIYRLGNSDEGLLFPNDDFKVPNVAVCLPHFQTPHEERCTSPEDIDGVVYGADLMGTGERKTNAGPFSGGFDSTTVSGSGNLAFFVNQAAMERWQPKALEILNGELELAQHVLADAIQRRYVPKGSGIQALTAAVKEQIHRENPDAYWYGCTCPKPSDFVPYFRKL